MNNNQVKILFVGDIVGQKALKFVCENLSYIKKDQDIDFCIVNAENAHSGLGLNKKLADLLVKSGCDCITLGNHTFAKADMLQSINDNNHIIRPLNGSYKWPGKGWQIFDLGDFKLCVVQVMGQVYMPPCGSPFESMEQLLNTISPGILNIVVDFHGEATGEKGVFARYFDGRITAVLGTHTHVQTADESILKNGTAFISDVGMTGPQNGILGLDELIAIKRTVECVPCRYQVADGNISMNSVIFSIDTNTGRCLDIKRFNIRE